jgi:uncharacterized membrane protein
MALDLAVVSFDGTNAAAQAFEAARERSSASAAWVRRVGFVEHHKNGHLVLRGTFAGHYVDIDEALHVSQRGAAEGWAIGGLIGVLGGPLGLVIGMTVGGVIGSQVGKPSEVDPEPAVLADQLRVAVPRGSSAMVAIADAQDVDALLAAVDDPRAQVSRKTLTSDEEAALQTALRDAPEASAGPFTEGEEAAEASEAGGTA